ncbi:MAG: TlpA family protein disulfide reductase [Egibacteraceae bacterium]
MREFVARHGLQNVAHIADTDGQVWERFGIVGQPAWVFVDGETREAQTVLGALTEGELRQRLETLEG